MGWCGVFLSALVLVVASTRSQAAGVPDYSRVDDDIERLGEDEVNAEGDPIEHRK